MVAVATVQELFGTFAGSTDEVAELVKSIVTFPVGARIYHRDQTFRQWTIPQSPSYTQYFTLEVRSLGEESQLAITVQGGWRNYDDGLADLSNGITVKLSDYRTSKDAVEALCKKFVERFQKPASRGNVRVYFDESRFMWVWKRPNSSSFCWTPDRSEAYHSASCVGVVNVQGNGVVPDEQFFFNNADRNAISNGTHQTITIVGGSYHFKSSLVPIFRNQIPFDTIHQHVPATSVYQYEFVMVNGDRRYINLKKAENSLLALPIHSYTTRIESLVPASKLFLLGKTDLYSRRDKDEVPFLGWELEACSNTSLVGSPATARAFKEQLPWLVMCKNDGSISPEGFETVSVPATLDFWQESNLSSALDSMRVAPYNMRSWEHVKCGFHVHVSRSALTVLDLQKLERFIHNPDNNTFITKIAGRTAGTYQKYDANLFSNRKKWSEIGGSGAVPTRDNNIVLEDVQYFFRSYDTAYNEISDYVQGGVGLRAQIINFGSYLSDCVSYSVLDRILVSHPLLRERYPGFVGYSIGDLTADMARTTPAYLSNMCRNVADPFNADEHNKLFRFLFEEVLCPGRPKFSAIVKRFFPDWNLTADEAPADQAEAPSWKVGTRKSSAPFKRSMSRAASQLIKGPVGKGVNSRYDALNTTNINTVEFRMFKGTMNGSTIMRYLEFVDAMVRFVANTNATNAGLHYTAFIQWLRGDAFNIARYEHLVSFITENGFLDRKDIRRRTLRTVVSEDKDVTGLVAVPAKGFTEVTEAKPIGSFTLTPEASEEPEPPAMSNDEAEEQYDVIDNSEPDECDCDDCRIARGEDID